jgi:hypothetical protein
LLSDINKKESGREPGSFGVAADKCREKETNIQFDMVGLIMSFAAMGVIPNTLL